MDVQLLVVPDCSNEHRSRDLLPRALIEAGAGDSPIRTVVVSTAEQAQELGFAGSPTILLNGADPFPTPDLPSALACRMYAQPGGLRGVPDIGALVAAIRRRAAGHSSTEAGCPPVSDRPTSAAVQAATDIAAGR